MKKVRVCTNPAAQQILFYLNNDLDEQTRAQVKEHLGRCRLCRDELEFMQIAKDSEKAKKWSPSGS